MESVLKRLVFIIFLFISPLAYSKTVSSVAIAPQGAALRTGSNQQFTATCSYSDGSTDNCAAAGGATWQTSTPVTSTITVNSSGLVTAAADPGAGTVRGAFVLVTAGGVTDRAGVFVQHPGDTWYQYITPDYRGYKDNLSNAQFPANVVVGSTVAVGSGVVANNSGSTTGSPFQDTCSWTSSDNTRATVNRMGLVTAIAPGTVNITCGRAGNAVFGSSSSAGWVSPGNVITLTIVNGGSGNQTWYVRPNGGTPYINAATTPHGQCDGKHDADYPGPTTARWLPSIVHNVGDLIADPQGNIEKVTTAGTSGTAGVPWSTTVGGTVADGTVVWTMQGPYPVNQACAVGNLRYLWTDMASWETMGWMISGGDTVIVRQNPNGYNMGKDANGVYVDPSSCYGDAGDCFMPSIPSGTATRHTRILGENYGSCSSDSAKTKLLGTWGAYTILNTTDSQFVDVACLEITDTAPCTANGNYTNHCTATSNATGNGILQSALTASVNYTDLFIHGLAADGMRGATGAGVVANRIHIRAMPDAGINMDDGPWGIGNISVAGGLTLNNSITEFTGCVEEYPVVHNYPYIECRDQTMGSYGDGFGTASATGDWHFDHDIWRYNFQDGLDLLHSGMNSLTITNSQSYGNDGQQFKIGSGKTVVFQNNLTLHNCLRLGQVIGDEPASAIVPGVSLCRAAGDGIPIAFDGQGTDIFQNNTYVGYGSTSYDMMCTGGWDSCPNTNSIFENNINVGIIHTGYDDDQAPGLFYTEQLLPANGGWAIRDHNLFYGFRHGCPTLNAGEICADPKFVAEPSLTVSIETLLDNFNFSLSSASPAKGTGITIPGLLTDILGLTRLDLPSMGAIEFGGSSVAPTPQPPTIALSATPSTITAGQTTTIAASLVSVGNVVPTGTVSFVNGTSVLGTASLNGSGVATLALSSLATGSYTVTAAYSGDGNYAAGVSSAVALQVNAATVTPPPVTTPPLTSGSGTTTPPLGSGTPPGTGTPTTVSITVARPDYGFNVIPGSTRRLFATVTNGSTNQVTWTVKSGSAQISSNSGSWIDVTAPVSGSSCSITGTSAQYAVTSAKQFIIEATSVDDATQKSDVTFNVCNPTVEVSVVPFYRTLYANQPADLQSLVLGSVNQKVHWSIASQPTGGDGNLTDSTSRDTIFTGTVPGRYYLTAVSVADPKQSATAIMYVTGNKMPYRVTPNQTEPVDCTVDPSMLGTVYEVGPSQSFKTLASVPFSTMAPGSTVRLHNEDTTGQSPTVYHEYVQLSQPATADQPFRMCGVPDKAGNLPIIDGDGAKGSQSTSADAVGTGLLTLHNSNNFAYWPKFSAAQYVTVEGIQFRNANPRNNYVAPGGTTKTWQNSSACIQVSEAQNAAFIGNDIASCSNGIVSAFNSNGGWGASDLNLLWEGNHIHNNGIAGSNLGHQMYLQSWANVVQFNRIDNYTPGALGANIKSRGLQDIFRYNYLGDGAQREMDLVDVKDAPAYMSFSGFLSGGANSFHALYSNDNYPANRIAAEQEAWNSHFVYGNIYQNSTSTAPIHFSMDTTGGELARKGSLYWYNNTFYERSCLTCSASLWTLFDTSGGNNTYFPQTEFQTVQAYNNIVWMDNAAKPVFQWNNYSAFIGIGGGNLLPSNWGTDAAAGGLGSGWNTTPNANAYQNSLPLSAHVNGLDKGDLVTSGSIPFDQISWTLNSKIAGTQAVPSAVCEMPARFAYLPGLGYAVPRIATPNVGATDTAADTADQINAVAGSGRYNTRYSNCR